MIRPMHALKFLLLTIMFSTYLLPETGVFAQDFGECTGDVMKFCKGVQPGKGDVSRCLMENQQGLTPGCQSRLSVLSEQVKDADQACQDDIMLYCGDMQPGGGRIVQCLKENGSSVSFNCRVKLGLIGFKSEN